MTIRPHQHALPIVGAKTAKANGSAPSPPTDYRPIHVSTFDRRGRDFYATPNWVIEALLQRFQFRGRPFRNISVIYVKLISSKKGAKAVIAFTSSIRSR